MFNVEQARTRRREGDSEGSSIPQPRRRWFKVRVATDDGIVLGSLRLDAGHSALRELLDDERSYLSLWGVQREGWDEVQEFVAIHKNVIRHVAVVGPCARGDAERTRGNAEYARGDAE